jgi:hypothetical protein
MRSDKVVSAALEMVEKRENMKHRFENLHNKNE